MIIIKQCYQTIASSCLRESLSIRPALVLLIFFFFLVLKILKIHQHYIGTFLKVLIRTKGEMEHKYIFKQCNSVLFNTISQNYTKSVLLLPVIGIPILS